jgi:hypothetical protein
MDDASKNAKDMIGSLQMNHGRQAAITNELVDIITGKFDSSPCIPSPYTPSTYFALQLLLNWDFDLPTHLFTGASAL